MDPKLVSLHPPTHVFIRSLVTQGGPERAVLAIVRYQKQRNQSLKSMWLKLAQISMDVFYFLLLKIEFTYFYRIDYAPSDNFMGKNRHLIFIFLFLDFKKVTKRW